MLNIKQVTSHQVPKGDDDDDNDYYYFLCTPDNYIADQLGFSLTTISRICGKWSARKNAPKKEILTEVKILSLKTQFWCQSETVHAMSFKKEGKLTES